MKTKLSVLSCALWFLIAFCSSSEAFEVGDEVVVFQDTTPKFYDTFTHPLKAGEKLKVAKHDKNSRTVYFLSKDAEGKQIALNVPEGMVGTVSEYEAQKKKAAGINSEIEAPTKAQRVNDLMKCIAEVKDKTFQPLSNADAKENAVAAIEHADLYIKIFGVVEKNVQDLVVTAKAKYSNVDINDSVAKEGADNTLNKCATTINDVLKSCLGTLDKSKETDKLKHLLLGSAGHIYTVQHVIGILAGTTIGAHAFLLNNTELNDSAVEKEKEWLYSLPKECSEMAKLIKEARDELQALIESPPKLRATNLNFRVLSFHLQGKLKSEVKDLIGPPDSATNNW